jgi:hypothetical protein
MEIARRGGGIHRPARPSRAVGRRPARPCNPRLRRLAAHGVTTVEVKSGYGLTPDDELKSLRVIAGWVRFSPWPGSNVAWRTRSPPRIPRDTGRTFRIRSLARLYDAPRRFVGGACPFRGRVLRAGCVHDRRVENDSHCRAGPPGWGSNSTPTSSGVSGAELAAEIGPRQLDHLAAHLRNGNPRARRIHYSCHAASRNDALPSERKSRRPPARSSTPALPWRWPPTSIPGRRDDELSTRHDPRRQSASDERSRNRSSRRREWRGRVVPRPMRLDRLRRIFPRSRAVRC